MWIICAGGKRSGSTLQYNIVSRIVEEAKKGKRITHFKIDEFPQIKKDNFHYEGLKVIKVHAVSKDVLAEIENGQAFVFHSYRDIRDVIVSSINKGWINKNDGVIKKSVKSYLNEYKSWTKIDGPIYSRKYEDFFDDLVNEIHFILGVLNLELSEDKVRLISEELSLLFLKKKQDKISEDKVCESFGQTFNKDTLLHTNHINDGSSNQFLKSLNVKEIVLIESLAYNFLIKNGYKIYWTMLNKFLSFSQHADDYIAWQLLGKKLDGIVVEVGAFDGKHLSNSYSLSQLGWQSVCIEPNPKIFEYLIKNRPETTNINKAIVGDESISEIEFYSEEIGVLSGCNYDEEDIKKRYKNRGLEYKEPQKIIVSAITLNSLFKSLSITKIDILSIDVEGFEMQVLKGLELNKIQVDLFIIEANSKGEKLSILNHFKTYNDYVFLGSNHQNLFIARKEVVKRKNLKTLKFDDYEKATQIHPSDDKLSLDSVTPNFIKSHDYIKSEKFLGIF